MSLTVVWEKLAVDKAVETDKQGNVTKADAVILNRGESLPDFVSDFVRSTLVQIGAVRDMGLAAEMVRNAVEQEFAEPPAPSQLSPEVPPPGTHTGGAVQIVHNAATGETATTSSGDVKAETVTASTSPEVSKPSASDGKEAWETYAVTKGYMSEAEAQAMTKTKLVAEVNKRESA